MTTTATMPVTSTLGNQFTEYTGIVLEDKARDSGDIKVYVRELLPFYNGPIEAKEVTGSANGYPIKNTNYITATYRGEGTNRSLPPDVKKGEQVSVFCYADGDIYYWKSLGRDDRLRRNEQVVFSAANSSKDPQDVNSDTAYQMEVNTHGDKKYVKLSTSKSDGEEFMYTILLDAKEGKINICDDAGNEVRIESKLPRVMAKNKDGCVVDLAQKNVTVCAPDDLVLKAGRQLIVNAPIVVTEASGNGACVINMNNAAINGQSIVINASCIGLQGAVEASNIVSGSVVAEGYSTHSVGRARSFVLTREASTSSQTQSTTGVQTPNGFTEAPAISATVPTNGRTDLSQPSPANTFGGYGTYTGVAALIAAGACTAVSNSPNTSGNGSGNNRHCAAWEQVSEAINLLCVELQKVDSFMRSKHGDSYGPALAAIQQLATAAEMFKNRGE